MKKITVSAPGKLVLLGDHAVVYNRPCLVTAVNKRMKITIEELDKPEFRLEAPDVKVSGYKKSFKELGKGDIPKGAKFVEIAVKNFIDVIARRNDEAISNKSGLKITTRSEFSAQYGFGSSSASAVCAVKALSELHKIKLTNKQIFDLAYKAVIEIQKKGSGVDVAAAVFGGTLYFVTAGKTIKPLVIDRLPLIIGYTGIKTDTVTLLNEVKEKSAKYPDIIEDIYDKIKKIVELAKTAIIKNDLQTFGELMDFNQGYLESLGVGSQKLANMIYSSREAGAYGAKLSGAGKGDCMIAIAPENKRKAVEQAIAKAGGEVIKVEANAPGVIIEP